MDNLQLKMKIYTYIWPNDSMRCAEIVFIYNDTGACFQFGHATYAGVGKQYCIDDWKFLRDLANVILQLEKEAIHG